MDSIAPKRRIVNTSIRTVEPAKEHPQAQQDSLNITTLPSINSLIADAMSIIATDIRKIKEKGITLKGLDLADSRVLQGHVKALVELSKEAREREKTNDPSKLSDAELLDAMQQLLGKKDQNAKA